jgi:hypothetical protein
MRAALLAAALSLAAGTALAQGGGSGSVSGPGGAEGPDSAGTIDPRYPTGAGAAGPAREGGPTANQAEPMPDQSRTGTTAPSTTGTFEPSSPPKAGKPAEQPGAVPGQPGATPD